MYKSAFSDHTLTILLKTSENHALPLLFFNFSYLRHSEMTHFETLPVESDGSGKCWVWFIIRNGERKEEALIKVPNCTSGLDCGQGRGPDGTSGDLQTYAEAFSYYLGQEASQHQVGDGCSLLPVYCRHFLLYRRCLLGLSMELGAPPTEVP